MTTVIQQYQNEEKTTTEKQKAEFRKLVNQNQNNYYKMGKILNKLKEELNDDEFTNFSNSSFRYSYSNMNKYMKIASEYEEKIATALGVKKAYLLLKIEKDVREVFIKEHNAYSKTFDELNELVNEHNSISKKERKINEKSTIKKLSKTTNEIYSNMCILYHRKAKGDVSPEKIEILKKLGELKELLDKIKETDEQQKSLSENNDLDL